ncbi:hypothetical protein [Sphingorhabdus sp.]
MRESPRWQKAGVALSQHEEYAVIAAHQIVLGETLGHILINWIPKVIDI